MSRTKAIKTRLITTQKVPMMRETATKQARYRPNLTSFNSASSTASITASILEYRTIQGRTYHSDRHPTEYFTPNDEQQRESVDIRSVLQAAKCVVTYLPISHHSLTLLLGGKLFLAPIGRDVKVSY
jgi:hypothetical protein